VRDFTGKRALITGAGGGIGRGIADVLAERGASVAINDVDLDLATAAADALQRAYGSSTVAVQGDVSKRADVERMFEAASTELGPIDILVNNAGTTWGAATVEHPLEAWQKVVNLNLTATFLVTQEVGKRCMVPRRRGKVINIASILGLVGGGEPNRPATLAYNTSKGGIVSFTRSLAAEWAAYDINVNAIAPGFFPTRMTKGLLEMIGDAAARKAPLGRIGGPEDLKGATALFASDACAFITGQVLAVDGGLVMM